MVGWARARRSQTCISMLALLALGGLQAWAFHVPVPRVSTRLRPAPQAFRATKIDQARLCSRPLPSLARTGPLLANAAGPWSSQSSSNKAVAGMRRRRRRRSVLLKRILVGLVGFAAMALVASKLPMMTAGVGASGGRGHVLATALSPFTSAQSQLSQLSKGPAGPLVAILSWAVDILEVGFDLVRWVVNILASPFVAVYRLLVSPLIQSPAYFLESVGRTVTELVTAVVTFPALVAGLVTDATSNLMRGVAMVLGGVFKVPGIYMVDTMNPRLRIPHQPTYFVPAKGIKIQPGFGLKQMYGRRWTVHAGKWDWAIPYWERVAMESQLVRYQSMYAASAEKVQSSLGLMFKGPGNAVGGTILVFALLYYGYYTSAKAAVWYKSLEASTYGKLTWNPVSRIEDDDSKEGDEEDGSKGSDEQGDDEDDDEED